MKKNETGKSLVEMIAVLALIGIIGMTGVMGYQTAVATNKGNQIAELVSIASMNGKTKMKDYDNASIWRAIGKNNDDYKCIDSLSVNRNGIVTVEFKTDSECTKVKNKAVSQWGNRWNEANKNYTPPADNVF